MCKHLTASNYLYKLTANISQGTPSLAHQSSKTKERKKERKQAVQTHQQAGVALFHHPLFFLVLLLVVGCRRSGVFGGSVRVVGVCGWVMASLCIDKESGLCGRCKRS